MILQAPKPSELLEKVAEARARGLSYIRFEVPPKRKYLERYVRLWDGVTGRAVSKRMEPVEMPNGETVLVLAALVVEVHCISVIEAAKRESMRDADLFTRPLAANQIQLNRPVIRPR